MDKNIVEIGAIVPVLANRMPYSNKVVLDGFKLAFLNRRVPVGTKEYSISDVFVDPKHPTKILARLLEVQPPVDLQSA